MPVAAVLGLSFGQYVVLGSIYVWGFVVLWGRYICACVYEFIIQYLAVTILNITK